MHAPSSVHLSCEAALQPPQVPQLSCTHRQAMKHPPFVVPPQYHSHCLNISAPKLAHNTDCIPSLLLGGCAVPGPKYPRFLY
eukprot:959242-Pelagomonas_calceolata.AAC.5